MATALVTCELTTGSAFWSGHWYDRTSRPKTFWLGIAFYAACAVLLCLVSIRGLLQPRVKLLPISGTWKPPNRCCINRPPRAAAKVGGWAAAGVAAFKYPHVQPRNAHAKLQSPPNAPLPQATAPQSRHGPDQTSLAPPVFQIRDCPPIIRRHGPLSVVPRPRATITASQDCTMATCPRGWQARNADKCQLGCQSQRRASVPPERHNGL